MNNRNDSNDHNPSKDALEDKTHEKEQLLTTLKM
jgi:hypothetical protein